MNITWNGHSCFTVETENGTVVFDPYRDGSVPGYAPLKLKADLVCCSHGHADHNGKETVELSGMDCGLEPETLCSWHDDAEGAKRGPNTITILRAEGMKFAHLGDLGCMLDEEQTAALEELDVLMIPVGGHYTIDSAQALEIVRQLKPRIVIPMHYRNGKLGYEVISTIDAFLKGSSNVVRYSGSTMEVTADTPAQTAVLRYS